MNSTYRLESFLAWCRYFAPFLVGFACLLSFGISSTYGISGYDDWMVLRDSEAVKWGGWNGLTRYWTQKIQGELFYIPTSYTLLALQKGLSLWTGVGYFKLIHTVNVALHVLITLLVFSFFIRLGISRSASAIGSAVFALHPLQAETVGWTLGQRDLWSAFFGVSAILLVPATGSRRSESHLRWVCAFALYFLSITSKPTAMVAPFAAVILAWAYERDLRQYLRFASGALLLAVPIIYLTLEFRESQTQRLSLDALERVRVVGNALWFYFAKLLLPISLVPHYEPMSLHRVLGEVAYLWGAVLGWGLWVTLLTLCSTDRKRLAAVICFVLLALPSLGVHPFSFQLHSIVADRFVYLSLVAVGILVASTLDDRPALPMRLPILLLVLGTLGVMSYRQVSIWQNPLQLWSKNLDVYPWSRVARSNMSNLFHEKGQCGMSIKVLEPYVEKFPSDEMIRINLAVEYSDVGKLELAEHHLRAVLEQNPSEVMALRNLGNLFYERKQWPKALAQYEKVLKLQPGRYDVLKDIADCYWELGEKEGAVERYQVYLNLGGNEEQARSRIQSWNRTATANTRLATEAM